MDEGDSGVCDSNEGPVTLLALRTLLTELLAIKLPSLEVGVGGVMSGSRGSRELVLWQGVW